MIDKITNKLRRYPFQTGIVIGILICLFCAGVISLFQDHGQSLAGNSEIIQQDYLRMTINEYNKNGDELLADWRYKHLGRKASDTLKLMKADESIPVWQLVTFAEAIGQEDKLGKNKEDQGTEIGTPSNPRKGISNFGKILLHFLGILVLAAGCLYLFSLIKTKKKQKRRSESTEPLNSESINLITPEKARSVQTNTPDTLFDLDSLFPHEGKNEPVQEQSSSDENVDYDSEKVYDQETEPDSEKESESDSDSEFDSTGILFHETIDEAAPDKQGNENNETKEETSDSNEETENEAENPDDRLPLMDNQIAEKETEDISEPEQVTIVESQSDNQKPELNFENLIRNIENTKTDSNETETFEETDKFIDKDSEHEISASAESKQGSEFPEESAADGNTQNNTEKPLIETDPENETENEDELLKIIRSSSTSGSDNINKPDDNKADNISSPADSNEEKVDNENTETEYYGKTPEETEQPNAAAENNLPQDILIHYQSVYKIGNDMYDEVFSIDQGDIFRGECGIGIGETLNNTEPKAVTAFEVWLFDKDDIHTATWYLMSDFALDNDGISKRLEQRGKCDRIRKNDVYVLETATLMVEIKVLELEYGKEMEEKNSYFTNVTFDVIARNKFVNEPEE